MAKECNRMKVQKIKREVAWVPTWVIGGIGEYEE
jgi:hypothetical protein